jgi:hypothetical protein
MEQINSGRPASLAEKIESNSAGLASVTPASDIQADMKFKVASITKMFATVGLWTEDTGHRT